MIDHEIKEYENPVASSLQVFAWSPVDGLKPIPVKKIKDRGYIFLLEWPGQPGTKRELPKAGVQIWPNNRLVCLHLPEQGIVLPECECFSDKNFVGITLSPSWATYQVVRQTYKSYMGLAEKDETEQFFTRDFFDALNVFVGETGQLIRIRLFDQKQITKDEFSFEVDPAFKPALTIEIDKAPDEPTLYRAQLIE